MTIRSATTHPIQWLRQQTTRAVVALFVVAATFSTEAHVSGGYEDCFADVGVTVCMMSDVRKSFVDATQAREWIASRQAQAERRLFTAMPVLRALLSQAQRRGLPIATVDDWRLPPIASFSTDAPPPTGPRRVHLDAGSVGNDLVSITFTAPRAPSDDDTRRFVELVQQAFKTPAYDPQRERENIYAPSLRLFAAGEVDEALPPLPPSAKNAPPAPPLAVDDVRAWQPLFVGENDAAVPHDAVLGIGTTMRLSPAAQAAWRPWFTTQLKALRAAWSSSSSSSLPPRLPSAPRAHGFREVDGFRPWGPLSLDDDIQARIDDGMIVRMARTRAATAQAASALYGPLTERLRAATTKTPLPAPPSSSSR